MATKSIAWNTGNGNITLTYVGQGNGPISIESDVNNLGISRSQTITVETIGGAIGKNITINQAACPIPAGTVLNYSYTGAEQTVTLPPGQYKLQCWGAQGGSNAAASSYSITAKAGGKGGYSEGIITLSQATVFKIFVGGQGSSSSGGFNGGGSTTGTSQYNTGGEFGISKMGGGGGASDIRLSDAQLLSRIIVAGGGGGGAMAYKSVTTTVPVSGSPTSPSSSGTLTHAGVSSAVWWDISSLGGKYVTISYSAGNNAPLYNGGTNVGISIISGNTTDYDFSNISSPKLYFNSTSNATITYYIYNSVPSAVKVEKVSSSYSQASIGAYYTTNYTTVGYRDNSNSANNVIPDGRNKCIGFPLSTSTTLIIGGYKYSWNGSKFEQQTTTSTSTYNYSQIGYIGGGVTGGGYSDTYKGKQNAAGTNGSFGQGANQTTTNYRYCSGAGGGGWYGGGGRYSDSTTSYVNQSGGGSGFVNTAANAQYRPNGYAGLELDSGETRDGATSFPNTAGTGNETGHSGNGYVKITRLS